MSSFTWGIIAGILVGLSVLLFILILYKRKNMKKNELDERQKVIRGSVALHTLIFGGVLLLINGAFVELTNKAWIEVGAQNLMIIGLSSTYFVIESVWRGAYFGKNFDQKRFRIFKLLALIYGLLVLVRLFDIFRGSIQLVNSAGRLSTDGWEFAVYVWVALLYGIIIWGWQRDKKK